MYCTTRCGLELTVPESCAAFQAQEDATLDEFARDGIFDRVPACTKLRGFQVGVATNSDGKTFVDAWGRTVGGYTECGPQVIVVANTRWHAQSNSLSHEVVHAIQDCYCVGDDCHYQWRERGIYDAIERARPDPD